MFLQLRKAVVGSALVFAVAASRPAVASNVYSYVTDQTSYTGPVGSTVAVKFYLKEQLTNGSTSFITRDGGLFAWQAQAVDPTVSDPNGAKIASAVVNSADFSGPQDVQIVPTPHTIVPPNGFNIGAAIGLPPAPGVQLGNTGGGASPATPSNEIYLATAYYTVGTVPSTLLIGAYHDQVYGYGGFTLTMGNAGGFYPDLDLGQYSDTFLPVPDVTGVGTTVTPFTISPPIFPLSIPGSVPEPGALGLLGVGGLLALRRGRR